jgi:flagellar motility protein MotE (MotC chaperone)
MFFFAMLILAPLAYIGASYANGEDGIENFKNLFKGEISMGTNASQEESETQSETTKTVKIPDPNAQSPANDQAALKAKDQKINDLEETNQQLQDALDEKTKELEEVQAQLKTIKDAIKVQIED